jgi:hypothetical protein
VIANMDSTTRKCAHHGLAWFPVFGADGDIDWDANPNYFASTLEQRKARTYPELGLSVTLPIYESFRLTPGPSSGSAIPRDLLHCGATSNRDGMKIATDSHSRPSGKSRLMVSR